MTLLASIARVAQLRPTRDTVPAPPRLALSTAGAGGSALLIDGGQRLVIGLSLGSWAAYSKAKPAETQRLLFQPHNGTSQV